MTKTIKGYKFIQSDMSSRNGGTKWIIGKWKRHDGGIEMCAKGFHACETAYQSLSYVYGDKWFIVEARGNILKDTNKFVASEMRLIKEIDVKKVLVPFACIVAKRSLANFEKKYPNDKRPREAIDAALKYAKNPTEANRSAAYSAADSAYSAARSAASAADSAESAARSAAYSAYSAAYSAYSAALSAAYSAEKLFQEKEMERLIKRSIGGKERKVQA